MRYASHVLPGRRRCVASIVATAVAVLLVAGCTSASNREPAATSTPPPPESTHHQVAPERAQPPLAADPALLVDDLVTDERTLRDPAASDDVTTAAARRQQAAYRVLARHPEWDAIAHPRVPASLREVYDRNVDARRQLEAMSRGPGKPTVPAWRVSPPTPIAELRRLYGEAEEASGVDWNYLAAINFVETAFGRIHGVSTAGAEGPMQFLPSTFAVYGRGDIWSPRDSILAAGRFLAARGFAHDRDAALFRYNNSRQYVRAVNHYAALIAAHPAAFEGFHRWDVYYRTAAGDVVLPVGYQADEPIPAQEYLAANPQ
ncbi:lytic transglycosylase domain-containing protein [Mycobacterium sp. SMC-4]|uniref:lytic transglycosylase domain-containing protein n=1 Tax=Mycobacterium sp. SMC-4 TaxID=2857059 RepID=UPI0021B497C8|nr:lytic transglycosylase domain-containing protein [Mycobacterium sp. SMC-4]UXA16749.1 lytic transglycosylase domain-containing protein [Mycobacterium sp. SMC-4]